MRIVAGTLKGRTIDAPDGTDTRPTTDRVREALFSSLFSLRGGFEGAVVLDAFAGSGALGIEALSRGANRAVFYKCADAAAKVLKRNISNCKLDPSRATVMRRDVMKNPPTQAQGTFDLVFLDPPYAFAPEDVAGLIESMRGNGALSDDAIVVYEHAIKTTRETTAAFEAAGLHIVASRKYGKTSVTVVDFGADEALEDEQLD